MTRAHAFVALPLALLAGCSRPPEAPSRARTDAAPLARDAGPGLALRAVWGASAGDIWAVGDDGWIVHFDGDRWRTDAFRASSTLRAVWGSGPRDVWAAGTFGTIVHFDGAAWSAVASGTRAALRGIWGASASEVWFVGEGGTILRRDARGAIARVPSGLPVPFFGVGGSGAADVWAVGAAGAIARWDGTAWRPMASGTQASLSGAWFARADDGWIVGAAEPGADAGHGAVALHWNGTALQRVTTISPVPLLAVGGARAEDVWATGLPSPAQVLHWDGTAWSVRSPDATGGYYGTWITPEGDAWIVGCCDPIARWHAGVWRRFPVEPRPAP